MKWSHHEIITIFEKVKVLEGDTLTVTAIPLVNDQVRKFEAGIFRLDSCAGSIYIFDNSSVYEKARIVLDMDIKKFRSLKDEFRGSVLFRLSGPNPSNIVLEKEIIFSKRDEIINGSVIWDVKEGEARITQDSAFE